jgi:cyclopropane-fatty-acyl-phospholipid synthase
MLLPPSELALGEAFMRGDLDVEGDLEAAAVLGSVIAERLRSPRRVVRLAKLLLQLPRREDGRAASEKRGSARVARLGRRHTRRRDAAAMRFHYDVGNDFYALWLDAHRVYSCGYFPTGEEDIDAAQLAKLEHVCRKLRLRPGERLLDIGCGWGGLVRYAARHYGVEALGITLSPAQAAYARQRIADDGLEERCRIEVRDYRDLPGDAVFDKVASVGMFEHVGPAQLATYFRAAFRLTATGGLFLNHGIVSLENARPLSLGDRLARRLWRQGEFLNRYVFPDGELVTLADVVRRAEAAGFETRDVESLREHYARTLRCWVRRLEHHRAEAVALVGDPTYCVWRLYMAVSAHAFTVGRIGVVQALLAKPGADGQCRLPATRADLYQAGGSPPDPNAR